MNYPAIEITNLQKTYASGQVALKGISLTIQQGEFFGLLGPNGAGKSTLINILAGVTKKSGGTATVLGHDTEKEPMVTKRLLGVVPQEISIDSFFNVEETLKYQSGYFGIWNNMPYIDELLTHLSLADKRTTNTRALSGGMKRRLLVAKAMVHRPPVLILDEPTAGVDVELRQNLYAHLRKINQEEGVTILLTTHYLEEAEALCNRIAIVNNGTVVALDTTENLLRKLGEDRQLVVTLKAFSSIPETLKQFRPEFDQKNLKLTLHFAADEYERVLHSLADTQLSIQHFRVKEEDLEDIFIKLTSQK